MVKAKAPGTTFLTSSLFHTECAAKTEKLFWERKMSRLKLDFTTQHWTTLRPLYCSTIPRWNRRDMLNMCFPFLTYHIFQAPKPSDNIWECLLVMTRAWVWKRKEKVVGISKAKENVLRRFQSKVKRRFQGWQKIFKISIQPGLLSSLSCESWQMLSLSWVDNVPHCPL